MPSNLVHIFIIGSLFVATVLLSPTFFWSPLLQVILLCWALFLFLYDGAKRGYLELKRSALPFPLLLFFLLAIFYTFHSIDYALSRDFFLQLVSYTAIFFLIAQLPSPERTRRVALTIVVLGSLTSLYGLYQYLWGFESLIGKIKEGEFAHVSPLIEEILGRLEGGRIFATFMLPSHFAAFLGMSIPLSIAFIIMVRKGWEKCLFGIALGPQILALSLTKSFSGWGSLILAYVCFVFVFLGYVKRVRTRYLAYSLAALLLLLVLVFAGLSLKRPDNPFAPVKNNPLVLRILNWGATIDMITDDPWIGKGLNTFGLIFPSYQRPGGNIVHHSHNTYLQLGVEMGVVGMLAFLWFACWWLWRTLLILKETKGKELTVWVGSLLVAGLAFCIHHAFDFEFYLSNVTLAGFAVLALTIAIEAEDRVYRIDLGGRRKTVSVLLGFGGVLAVSILLLFQLYGQMHYQKARYRLETGSLFAVNAARGFKKSIHFDPYNSRYHHQYGVLLFQRLSRQQEGISEVQEAIRLSPWRHYYHFDLGMMYLISGEESKGVEEIKRASQLYPLNEKYHQFLMTIYLQRGEAELASEEEEWIEKIQRGERVD